MGSEATMPDGASNGEWLRRAWRLNPNRVSRFYRGGLLLDQFRGAPEPADTDRPEDWVGSATRTWAPPGTAPTDEGLSIAELDGQDRRVADILAIDAAAVGGTDLAHLGPTTGILVKLLDAGIRLPVHAHPTREFARRHLRSPFGKAEAWIVLGTRTVPGAPEPHVRLGFRRPVGREELRAWIDEQRTTTLLDAMVQRPTAAGDVWFVPPGTPHAIGAGVFILEVQEPTDFSIVLETAGFPIDPADASLRLGWDLMIDAVDRRALDDPAVDGLRSSLDAGLRRPAAPFFWARRVIVEGDAALDAPERFVVGVVTGGSGAVLTPPARLAVAAGDTFAIPAAAVRSARFESEGRLEVILCGSTGPPEAAS
jgi:mannose-6-phosphate isomerase